MRFIEKSCNDRILKEQTIKLINTLVLYKTGRDYLSKESKILETVLECVGTENSDSKIRQNGMGILQRMSTRRRIQSKLIDLGTIEALLSMMTSELDNFSEDTVEYSTALFMNLCLRSAGKKHCAEVAGQTLKILTDLMEYENPQVCRE